jgi:hypothetical protein
MKSADVHEADSKTRAIWRALLSVRFLASPPLYYDLALDDEETGGIPLTLDATKSTNS